MSYSWFETNSIVLITVTGSSTGRGEWNTNAPNESIIERSLKVWTTSRYAENVALAEEEKKGPMSRLGSGHTPRGGAKLHWLAAFMSMLSKL